MKRWFILFISFILIFMIPIKALAGENNNMELKEIDIRLTPEEILFNVDNMKPGDWVPRSVIVQNAGRMDFAYEITVENRGSEKLFNELIMEINSDKENLYYGKLSEFKKLPLRNLKASSEEKIDITIRFPEKLGNEYQGSKFTNSHFSFIFNAKGMNSGMEDGGFSLPSTSTNLYNLLVLGSLLISVGLVFASLHHIHYKRLN